MKKTLFLFLSFLTGSFAFGQDLQKSKKVADVVTVGNEKLTVCKWSLLKDTVTLPLSYFTEELQMIKLDDRDEALVSTQSSVVIGEKYILTGGVGRQKITFKLFDKSGKYLTNIGSFGQGPGEYDNNIADAVLDEKNGRVYILSWSTRNILEYDLKGKFIQPIKMPGSITKGKISVDPSGELISVVSVPLDGNKYVAWTQKKSGDIVSAVEPGNLSINPREPDGAYSAYNHEIMSSKNLGGVFDAYIFCYHLRKDTLYRYKVGSDRLSPQFTMDFGNNLRTHAFFEFPNHYTGWTGEEIRDSENSSYIGNYKFFIVEKSSLKGTFFKVRNDYFGDIEIGWPTYSFSNGYYIKNYEPAELIDLLDKTLSSNKLPAAMKEKLSKLKKSISENDNNYIFYAKMKK